MAYLDPLVAYNQPQYWTAAVYQRQPSGGYKFIRWTPAVVSKWIPFASALMDRYSLTRGYQTYQFYWDSLAGQWIRQSNNRPAVSGEVLTVGKVERRSPLPPGRYWQDIFVKHTPAWNRWAEEHILKTGDVKLIKSEVFTESPLTDGRILPDFLRGGGLFELPTGEAGGIIPYRFWVLFEVLRPVPWPATDLGFPEIATPDVHQSSDTAQNPPGPSPVEEIGDAVKSAVVPVVGVLAALLGVKLFIELKR